MYDFLTGPLLWLSLAVFVGGCVWRVVKYVKGLAWQLDRVAYTAHPVPGIKGALRSVFLWLIPFKTASWRQKPVFTIMFFVFHIGMVMIPLFLYAHAMLIRESWGIYWPALPGGLADALTIGVIVVGVLYAIRRLILAEVRILNTAQDFVVLAIALAPFVTGFICRYQLGGDYNFWLYLHILSGELMLVAIPFTKLSHFVLFFCSRAQLGMDFGIKRGGMKGTSMNW